MLSETETVQSLDGSHRSIERETEWLTKRRSSVFERSRVHNTEVASLRVRTKETDFDLKIEGIVCVCVCVCKYCICGGGGGKWY